MITLTRGLATGAVLVGAAVGLAGPASAEPLSGSYTATIIESSNLEIAPLGKGLALTLTPCGADCTTIAAPNAKTQWTSELRLQGNTWTGTRVMGEGVCTLTLDNTSLDLVQACPPVTIRYTLL